MATPRALLVDSDYALNHRLVSRCERSCWFCRLDKVRRKDCWHRKSALEVRLLRLVQCFAVELHAFAIVTNHFSSRTLTTHWLVLNGPLTKWRSVGLQPWCHSLNDTNFRHRKLLRWL